MLFGYIMGPTSITSIWGCDVSAKFYRNGKGWWWLCHYFGTDFYCSCFLSSWVSHSTASLGIEDPLGILELFMSLLSPSALISFVPLRVSPSYLSSSVLVCDTSCAKPSGVSSLDTTPVSPRRVSGSIVGILGSF